MNPWWGSLNGGCTTELNYIYYNATIRYIKKVFT
jgi:hypothetical protein